MRRKGQALVVVLLVIGVAVTVGLAIMSRSVTEVRVSSVQEESLRALEAAEAGVEKALGGIVAIGGTGTGTLPVAGSSYSVTNALLGGNAYQIPYELENGEAATVNLSGWNKGNNLCLSWGKAGTTEAPAVELTLYFSQGGAVGASRIGLDEDADTRGNGFQVPAPLGCIKTGFELVHKVQFNQDFGLTGTDAPLAMRVRMLYNSSPQPARIATVGVGIDLPAQGKDISAVGQAGDAVQRLRVVQMNADLPVMFDSVIFSGTSLVK